MIFNVHAIKTSLYQVYLTLFLNFSISNSDQYKDISKFEIFLSLINGLFFIPSALILRILVDQFTPFMFFSPKCMFQKNCKSLFFVMIDFSISYIFFLKKNWFEFIKPLEVVKIFTLSFKYFCQFYDLLTFSHYIYFAYISI